MNLTFVTRCACACVLLLAGSASAWPKKIPAGFESDTARVARQDESTAKRFLRPRLQARGFVYLPRAYYSEETSFGLGGHVVRPFRKSAGGPPREDGEVRVKGRVTIKGHALVETRFRLVWDEGKYTVNSKVSTENLPRRFYGIGPDTRLENKEVYEPRRTLAYVELLKTISDEFRVGVRAEFEDFRLLEVEPGGILEAGNVLGTEAGQVIGSGVLFEWDSRNRKYSPTSGSYHQAFALVFDGSIGSDHAFNVYNVDLRRYFAIRHGHTLVAQAFVYVTRGSPPFWRLAELGARAHSRGYRKGRFLERALLAYQAEYRFDLWRRWGGAVFGGYSDVARGLGRLENEHMRPTVGIGLRYRLGDEDGIRASLDAAFGQEDARVHFSLDEAF